MIDSFSFKMMLTYFHDSSKIAILNSALLTHMKDVSLCYISGQLASGLSVWQVKNLTLLLSET